MEALCSGAKRFYTGKMCLNGHTVERYTSTTECVECSRVAHRTYYQAKKIRKETGEAQIVTAAAAKYHVWDKK